MNNSQNFFDNNQMTNNNQSVNQTQPVANQNIKTDFSGKKVTGKNANRPIRFKYKVKDEEGKMIESYFDAESRIDVESYLLNKSYEIISIEEDKLSTSLGLTTMYRKMNSKDLNFFLMQLSTYVKSGIPLLDSMEILSRQAKNRDVQMLYKKIVFELNR